jgi:hypothetical protein
VVITAIQHSQSFGQAEVIQELRRRIQFLRDDAPAIANSLNPEAPVEILNLYQELEEIGGGP